MPQPQTATADQQPAQPRRRRLVRWSVGTVAAFLFLFLLVGVTNLFVQPAQGTPVTRAADHHPEFAASARLLEANCRDCHADNPKLPFYANLPGVAALVHADMQRGGKFFNIDRELCPEQSQAYNEAALAKLAYVLEHQTMPPTRYVALHWDRGLSAAEQADILAEIRAIRAAHYTTAGVAPRFATAAYQPLPDGVPVNESQAALGEQMYHDVRLSGDNTISCATCHAIDTGGCDQAPVSTGIDGQKGPINAPTVFNAVFHIAQFWDGRAADLVEQAAGPVHNPLEMGSDWDEVLPKLRQDPELVAAFADAYPDGLTGDNIAHAIAEFEKTLVTPNSAFDQFLKGDHTALNETQRAGFQLFEQNACANCHVGKALGGRSYERMGRAKPYFSADTTDADLGRYNVTQDPADKHCFKVPSLRNIALTYPYFHDGSATTLPDAVRVMAETQAYRSFTNEELAQVVAFLETLTGEYRGKKLTKLQ